MNLKLTLATLMAVLMMTLLGSSGIPFVSQPVAEAQGPNADLLTEIPIEGTVPGGTFEGVLTITELALENGELLASGVLEGTATVGGVVTEITQTFTDIPVGLLSGDDNVCQILNLDLGPIHLDILGLVVDLDEVHLDITGETGPGRLLGNLLCALAGLLDNDGPLDRILRILDRINDILN